MIRLMPWNGPLLGHSPSPPSFNKVALPYLQNCSYPNMDHNHCYKDVLGSLCIFIKVTEIQNYVFHDLVSFEELE